MLGPLLQRREAGCILPLQEPVAEIRPHYTYLQTLIFSHCPLFPNPPNHHTPLHFELWLSRFSGISLASGEVNKRSLMQRKRQVPHLNVTQFRASIWLSQHRAGHQRPDLETIKHKKPHWCSTAPGQVTGAQAFSLPSCPSACLTGIPHIAYR